MHDDDKAAGDEMTVESHIVAVNPAEFVKLRNPDITRVLGKRFETNRIFRPVGSPSAIRSIGLSRFPSNRTFYCRVGAKERLGGELGIPKYGEGSLKLPAGRSACVLGATRSICRSLGATLCAYPVSP